MEIESDVLINDAAFSAGAAGVPRGTRQVWSCESVKIRAMRRPIVGSKFCFELTSKHGGPAKTRT